MASPSDPHPSAEEAAALRSRLVELEERDGLYSSLLSHLNAMVYRCRNDEDWTMELVSYGAINLTGYPPDHLIDNCKLSFGSLVHPEDAGPLWDKCRASLDARRRCSNEYRILRADGQVRWVWDQANGIYDDSGNLLAVEGFITDITAQKEAAAEREALESRLRLSEKMEIVGRLAGGIAHDFNNLLTAILGNNSLLSERLLPEDSDLTTHIDQINAAAVRAAALTRQLLAFARRQVMESEPLDVSEVVSNLEQMLRRLIGEQITLSVDLDRELPTVVADRSQLEQVLMNLVLNARDAMPSGGTIQIATSSTTLSDDDADTQNFAAAGKKVTLTISDDGAGMDSSTLDHVFEPFFSTKPEGRGTGMGLATVYGIVTQLGGDVRVESTTGYGSTFRIYLPTTLAEARPPRRLEKRTVERSPGGEVILICEDEDPVREVIVAVLSANGYVVLSAATGARAVDLLRQRGDAIDLLITDVVMPGMSGVELADRVGGILPEVPVIFISGYAEEISGVQAMRRRGALFIPKPFDSTLLLLSVREALDAVPSVTAR